MRTHDDDDGYAVEQPLCYDMCQTFHDRCTVDSVDFLRRGMGPAYALYTCNGVKNSTLACSPAARARVSSLGGVGAGWLSAAVGLLASALLLRSSAGAFDH